MTLNNYGYGVLKTDFESIKGYLMDYLNFLNQKKLFHDKCAKEERSLMYTAKEYSADYNTHLRNEMLDLGMRGDCIEMIGELFNLLIGLGISFKYDKENEKYILTEEEEENE